MKIKNGNYAGSKEAWQKLSREVWVRDNYTCFFCKRHRRNFQLGETLNTHHVLPLSKGGTDSKANLMTICSTCHAKQHGHMGKTNKSFVLKNGISKSKRLKTAQKVKKYY